MDKRARETISELQDKILPLFEEHGTVLALDEYKASPALERVLKNHEKGIYKESDLDVLKSKARIMKNIDRHSPENFIELPTLTIDTVRLLLWIQRTVKVQSTLL